MLKWLKSCFIEFWYGPQGSNKPLVSEGELQSSLVILGYCLYKPETKQFYHGRHEHVKPGQIPYVIRANVSMAKIFPSKASARYFKQESENWALQAAQVGPLRGFHIKPIYMSTLEGS